MDHLHNMIVTTIWGAPTPETAWRIPATPCLSVLGADGERLRERLTRGPLRVTLTTRVRTGWTPIPHLVGALAGRAEDRFVLFSGHVDAWHHGAMDNGTANATMLEIARLLATRRDALARGIRFAFWSGHSRAMERLVGSAGFPWWWHTKDDTVDKVDANVLALDTKVYLATALRWLNAPVLPLDHRRAARSVLTELEALQAAAGARFDLGPALEAARALAGRLERVAERLERVEPARAEAVNA